MASQTLETNVRIRANADKNSFSQVGDTLTQLGNEVSVISNKLIDMGKTSLNVYKDYEYNMAAAYGVMRDNADPENLVEFERQWREMEALVQQWAATTRFHTSDTSNALLEASRAGWDFQKAAEGIPAAMLLAQAGSMDLSTALDYVIKGLNITKTDFSQAEIFVDQFVKASNKAATNAEEMGEALLALGMNAQFTDSTAELFTMLDILADAGTTGSKAGTLLRNMLIRLVSPTQSAADAMYYLGISAEEYEEAMEGGNPEEIAAALEAIGFNAYDAQHNLKPMAQMFRELYELTEQMTEEERNGLLGKIFPQRSITGAKAILDSMADDAFKWNDIYQAILGSGGAAQAFSDIMMDTLFSAEATFESKIEALEVRIGESLAPTVESFMEKAGAFIDSITGLDEATFNALVNGLSTIAGLGPGLLFAGGAFRIIGNLLGPGGLAVAGLATLVSAAEAIRTLNEYEWQDSFGDMTIDKASITGYMSEIGDSFNSAYTHVNNFNTAIETAIGDFTTASSTFNSDLLTLLVTDQELTEGDKTKLAGLGEDMYEALLNGLAAANNKQNAYWEMIASGETASDAQVESLFAVSQAVYESTIANAERISQDFRNALTSAFADGKISDEEYDALQAFMGDYQRAMSEVAAMSEDRDSYIAHQKMMQRATTASLSEMQEISEAAKAEHDANVQAATDAYWDAYFSAQYDYDKAIAEGLTDENGNLFTEEMKQAALDAITQDYNNRIAAYNAQFAEVMLELWDSQLRNQPEHAEDYRQLSAIAQAWMGGYLTEEQAMGYVTSALGESYYAGQGGDASKQGRAWLGRGLGVMEYYTGGSYAGLLEAANTALESGNTALADRLALLAAMEYLANGGYAIQDYGVNEGNIWEQMIGKAGGTFSTSGSSLSAMQGQFPGGTALYNSVSGLVAPAENLTDMEQFPEYQATIAGMDAVIADMQQAVGLSRDLNGLVSPLLNQYASWAGSNPDEAAAARTASMYSRFDETDQGIYDRVMQNLLANFDTEGLWNALLGYRAGAGLSDLSGVTEDIRNNILAGVVRYGDASQYDINLSDYYTGPQPVEAVVDLDTSAADSYFNNTKIINAALNLFGMGGNQNTKEKYATGGRATVASIFGEAGPEWAIPEEHSQRTADLLNLARAASGFTWPELLSRYGGLNAGSGARTFVYAPVIHAENGDGVARALDYDKARMERWWNERRLRDEVEVYA